MTRRSTFIFLLLTWTTVLPAAPLDRRKLPAGVKWFVHFDADAGRSSVVGQTVLLGMRADPNVRQLLAKFREHFNVDPTQDIRGITVFGTNLSPDAGVLVVRGRFDREKLTDMLHKLDGFRSESYANHEIYTWSENGPDRSAHNFAGAFFDSDTLIFSSSETGVKGALDVMDSSALPLSSQSPLADPAPAGSMIEAAALGLAGAQELEIQSPLLRQCDYGRFYAGEKAGVAFVHAVAMTRAPEMADQVCRVVQGMLAFGQLSAAGTDAGKLLAPIQVKSDGSAVNVDWQMSADSFAELLVGELHRTIDATRPKDPETKP